MSFRLAGATQGDGVSNKTKRDDLAPPTPKGLPDLPWKRQEFRRSHWGVGRCMCPVYGARGEGQPHCGALERQLHPLTSDSSRATGPGASLSCSPLGPPAHPLHLVSLTLLGPRVYPLVTCTVPEGVLPLWLPCLHPLWSPSCSLPVTACLFVVSDVCNQPQLCH